MAIRISTIIPCIKLSPFLKESIDSIKKQNIKPDEIILWCNGFKPETNYLNQLLCGTYIKMATSNKFLPMAESWNQAANLAKGDFVHILHDDDWIEPHFYEHILKQLNQAPDVGIWFGGTFNRISKSEKPLYISAFPDSTYTDASSLGTWIFSKSSSRCVSTVLNRRCFYSIGGFDPCLRQFLDIDLFWRIAYRCGSLTSSEVVGNYRIHPSSATGRDIQNSRQLAIEDSRLASDIKHMLKKYYGTPLCSTEFLNFYRTTALGCLRYSLRRGHFRNVLSSLGNLHQLWQLQH